VNNLRLSLTNVVGTEDNSGRTNLFLNTVSSGQHIVVAQHGTTAEAGATLHVQVQRHLVGKLVGSGLLASNNSLLVLNGASGHSESSQAILEEGQQFDGANVRPSVDASARAMAHSALRTNKTFMVSEKFHDLLKLDIGGVWLFIIFFVSKALSEAEISFLEISGDLWVLIAGIKLGFLGGNS
jgi:hypothetical protein